MDSLVAEGVMGWVLGAESWGKGAGNVWHSRKESGAYARGSLPQSISWEWRPSTDIAAAWEVVRKLTEMPSPYLVGIRNVASARGVEWEVSITEDVVADTAPLAICRAALLTTLEAK